MIKAEVNVTGRITRNAMIRTDKSGKPYVAFAMAISLPDAKNTTNEVAIFVSIPNGQQTDLAATLLTQLGYDASAFPFSHDMMSQEVPHYAFYAWPDGFGLLSETASYVQDNNYDGHPLTGSDDPEGKAERMGKAYLQRLYDDLSKR